MRRDFSGQTLNDKLIEELLNVDKSSSNNKYRSKVVVICLKAVECTGRGYKKGN